jgi:hypothetical protein
MPVPTWFLFLVTILVVLAIFALIGLQVDVD